jgi:hypothetical protein
MNCVAAQKPMVFDEELIARLGEREKQIRQGLGKPLKKEYLPVNNEEQERVAAAV